MTTRTEQDIREEAAARLDRYNGGEHKTIDYDMPDLHEELVELREVLRREYEELAADLAGETRKLLALGIVCGPHWTEKEKELGSEYLTPNEQNLSPHYAKINNYIERATKVEHVVNVREQDLYLKSDLTDYPLIDLYVVYEPQYGHPSLNVLAFDNLFDEGSSNVSFGGVMPKAPKTQEPLRMEPTLRFVGKYKGVFCHVSLHLVNREDERE